MLAAFLALALQAEPAKIDIRPNAGAAWGAEIADVRKVLDAAASELAKHFPGREIAPILVEPAGGPITLFKRGANGEYQVRLATGKTLWAQYTFQFAHELCHILCGYDEDPHANKWFEESVCEAASLFVLRRSAETWKTSPPYPNWKDYAPHLKSYADDRTKAATLPGEKTFAQWYRDNEKELAKNAVDRDRNNVVAGQLLPLLEKDPSRWEAVAWLNTEKMDAATTFAQFLAAWHRNAPEKHRAFVKAVAALFEVEIR